MLLLAFQGSIPGPAAYPTKRRASLELLSLTSASPCQPRVPRDCMPLALIGLSRQQSKSTITRLSGVSLWIIELSIHASETQPSSASALVPIEEGASMGIKKILAVHLAAMPCKEQAQVVDSLSRHAQKLSFISRFFWFSKTFCLKPCVRSASPIFRASLSGCKSLSSGLEYSPLPIRNACLSRLGSMFPGSRKAGVRFVTFALLRAPSDAEGPVILRSFASSTGFNFKSLT